MLRLSVLSLDFRWSSEVYESAEENDFRLRFFSDSLRCRGGRGDLDMLIDLVKDLDSLRPDSLRCGDLDMLDRMGSRLAEFLDFSLGDGDRDMLVDIVDTEADEGEADRILLGAARISGSSLCLSRFRPLSCSAFASCSSATPFLQFHVSQRLNHHFRKELGQLISCGGKKYELSEQLLRYVTCQFWHKFWIQKLLCPGRT